MLTKEQIKERLKDANISQVARNSGVHRNQIARVLNGKQIMGEAMLKLINYLEK